MNTSQGKGTGVGLNICRETVRLHGGDIAYKRIKQDDGQLRGSEFYFWVKFQPVQIPVEAPVPSFMLTASEDAVHQGSVQLKDDMSLWRFLLVDGTIFYQ